MTCGYSQRDLHLPGKFYNVSVQLECFFLRLRSFQVLLQFIILLSPTELIIYLSFSQIFFLPN